MGKELAGREKNPVIFSLAPLIGFKVHPEQLGISRGKLPDVSRDPSADNSLWRDHWSSRSGGERYWTWSPVSSVGSHSGRLGLAVSATGHGRPLAQSVVILAVGLTVSATGHGRPLAQSVVILAVVLTVSATGHGRALAQSVVILAVGLTSKPDVIMKVALAVCMTLVLFSIAATFEYVCLSGRDACIHNIESRYDYNGSLRCCPMGLHDMVLTDRSCVCYD
ncbi:hypothetical protein EGW08_001997 [Elysia chlorotica]|uniref:Uncharacterized protein n=1 Tax=Elysia chlorotica TaxID=188477 RepID=A0A3S1BW87_ELYCH|nr:hypothetical protein EGW08_001997 [Elysia chlorotica]